jgi:hypothetical protein
MRPEPARITLSLTPAGKRYRLAREAAGEKAAMPFSSNSFFLLPERDRAPALAWLAWGVGNKESSDVVPASDMGPMSGQNSPCMVVDLHLKDTLHPGSFEAEIHTADTREERAKSERHGYFCVGNRP